MQSEDDSPPPMRTTRSAEPLSEDDPGELAASLRGAPLGIARNVRLTKLVAKLIDQLEIGR